MTIASVKALIISLPKLKSRKRILSKFIELSAENDQKRQETEQEYREIIFKIQILEASLMILTQEESNIVYMHIMQGYTWNEIMKVYEKMYEKEFRRSERTLKRIQETALKKIVQFIEETKVEEYVS